MVYYFSIKCKHPAVMATPVKDILGSIKLHRHTQTPVLRQRLFVCVLLGVFHAFTTRYQQMI